jgi:hypothetical protein
MGLILASSGVDERVYREIREIREIKGRTACEWPPFARRSRISPDSL